ncbi:N-acetyl-gamma-glutamyl-phosphate reductase [Paenibacillus sp. WLX2291]|uniref:N-acetyl-gamma-glutamyl-phosphate reductase n=1 Tax=Paenibacillus sp. WLX2291 TaxID=3296934 RepID=UPI0039843BF5
MSTYRVGILGGNGFVGGELYRLLSAHPNFQVEFVSSESQAGRPVEKTHKAFLYRKVNPKLTYSKLAELDGEYDLIFSALPTGILPQHLEHVLNHTQRIFNISGDYRFTDNNVLKQYYPDSISTVKQAGSHYFIPEISEWNRDARLVNLPGCMAVASIYSIYPLVLHSLIQGHVFIDAKTGSSGAGKSSKETHADRVNNFRLHKGFEHRHLPEIERIASTYSEHKLDVSFSAFSLDVARGIFVSAYSVLREGVEESDVKKAFFQAYKSKPFIRYSGQSSPGPMLKTVHGTNYAETAFIVKDSKCLSLVSIDNLLKGAAGQAIQAANIYYDIPEITGLTTEHEGIWP